MKKVTVNFPTTKEEAKEVLEKMKETGEKIMNKTGLVNVWKKLDNWTTKVAEKAVTEIKKNPQIMEELKSLKETIKSKELLPKDVVIELKEEPKPEPEPESQLIVEPKELPPIEFVKDSEEPEK